MNNQFKEEREKDIFQVLIDKCTPTSIVEKSFLKRYPQVATVSFKSDSKELISICIPSEYIISGLAEINP